MMSNTFQFYWTASFAKRFPSAPLFLHDTINDGGETSVILLRNVLRFRDDKHGTRFSPI